MSARHRPLMPIVGACLAVLLLVGFAAAPDVVSLRKGGKHPKSLPVASFSHLTHQSVGCFSCHPQLFDNRRVAVTHRAMKQGLACGACHDGSTAVAVQKLECRACHVR